jgi:hypothetical protein
MPCARTSASSRRPPASTASSSCGPPTPSATVGGHTHSRHILHTSPHTSTLLPTLPHFSPPPSAAVVDGVNDTADNLLAAIERNEPEVSPSTLYAVAAAKEGVPFVNGSPQVRFYVGWVGRGGGGVGRIDSGASRLGNTHTPSFAAPSVPTVHSRDVSPPPLLPHRTPSCPA